MGKRIYLSALAVMGAFIQGAWGEDLSKLQAELQSLEKDILEKPLSPGKLNHLLLNRFLKKKRKKKNTFNPEAIPGNIAPTPRRTRLIHASLRGSEVFPRDPPDHGR